MRRGIALSGVMVLACVVGAWPAGAWSEAEVTELRTQARILRRDRGVTASFFVAATAPQAYRILTDHARLPEFMPNLDACRVLAQGPHWAEIEMRNPRGRMILRREFEPPHRIRWSLVKSPMLKRVDGSWRLDPVPGGTVLTYDSEVEAALPVPAFVLRIVQHDALGALVSNVRHRIDSNGTWIKPDFAKGSPE